MRRLTTGVSLVNQRSARYSQVQGLGVERRSLVLQCSDDCDQGIETITEKEVSGLSDVNACFGIDKGHYQVYECLLQLKAQSECVIDLLKPVVVSMPLSSSMQPHSPDSQVGSPRR
jgi:hypothetical protein